MPSRSETFSGIYGLLFGGTSNRVKYKQGTTSASWWWLRSAGNTIKFDFVDITGLLSNESAFFEGGVVLCFCT